MYFESIKKKSPKDNTQKYYKILVKGLVTNKMQ